MNEDIVLFLDADGAPAALRDRCCHRFGKAIQGLDGRGPDRLRLSWLDV